MVVAWTSSARRRASNSQSSIHANVGAPGEDGAARLWQEAHRGNRRRLGEGNQGRPHGSFGNGSLSLPSAASCSTVLLSLPIASGGGPAGVSAMTEAR